MKRHGTATKRLGAWLVALGLVAALPGWGSAYQRPGRTERVSVAHDGSAANGGLGPTIAPLVAVSADGRFVAFPSLASNLVPGDTNGQRDVFVRDRATATTELVSVASDDTQGDGSSHQPSISADGRYVAFRSDASNLVPGDTNGVGDIFVRDRVTGTTERVSVASDGTEADRFSEQPSISADGRHVAFTTRSSTLVPGDTNGREDVFVRDRAAGTTERVSLGPQDTEGNDNAGDAAISADGRYVAFRSFAWNFPGSTTRERGDIFVRDRETGITELVSVATDGGEGNDHSMGTAISADGRYVAFMSWASNLVPHDTFGFTAPSAVGSASDIFVRDLETGITERVSVASDGTEANGSSHDALSISADGRYVAFASFATNLVPSDTNNAMDVFVHDRASGATELVPKAGVFSAWPSISAEGRFVAFASPGAAFVWDRGPSVGVGELSAVREGDRISVSGWATFSGDTVVSAADPEDDGAREVGAELTGADVTYRPEREDLLVRLGLRSLPTTAAGACATFLVCVGGSAGAGAPAILYGVGFDLDGTRYEVRVLRAGATGLPPATPYFALYRCDPDCTEQTRLSGGIGTTGTEVVVSVPLTDLGVEEEAALGAIRAFTAVGEAAPGALQVLDEVDLPDAIIPATRVSLGIAPAGSPQGEVAFDIEAALTEGEFSGALDANGLPPGEYDVWGRACLGEVCGAASKPVTLG